MLDTEKERKNKEMIIGSKDEKFLPLSFSFQTYSLPIDKKLKKDVL